jgi:short-subunit dehydrogenase
MGLDLDGRRVLLTGASGGIGNALARALHGRGATVVVTGRRSDALEALVSELGDRIEPLVCDLAERVEADALPGRAGAIDALVANAALPASGRFFEFPPEEIDRALEVNLRAPAQLARALGPPMVERGYGALAFISSLSGKAASPGSGLYSATKFGLRGLAGGLREDLHGSGVGVTCVFPGFIRDAGMFHEAGTKLPMGVGTRTPEQVAAATVKGIERDRGEVSVAPMGLRAGSAFGGLAPRVSSVIQRRLGGAKIAEDMARGQADKR